MLPVFAWTKSCFVFDGTGEESYIMMNFYQTTKR